MGLKVRGRIEGFAEAVASPAPAPGGGAVAAVCGALSAALARMVAGIALEKRAYREVRRELLTICKESETLQDRLLELAEEDSKAYSAVIKALSLPKATQAEKLKRSTAVQSALRKATEVPLETMKECLKVLDLSKTALEKGSREAFTDAGTAALIAHAALEGAGLNVRVNLLSIKDKAFSRRTESHMRSLAGKAGTLMKEIQKTIAKRF